ncbi:MAG: queuosine precursor transporter [Propioniciclava sp.]
MTPSGPPPTAATARGQRYYDLVVATFVAVLLISNIAATKLIGFGPSWSVAGFPVLPIITDGGAFLFPVAYVLGDVLAEVYGLRQARRAIWAGFVLAGLMSFTFLVVDAAPPAAAWPNQAAWSAVLGFVPRIVVASLAGYLAGQLLNAWLLVRIKQRHGEQRLWVRLVTSSVVGEFVDTVLFCTIAFGPLGAWLGGGSIPAPQLLNYVVVGWIYKVLVEVLLLPLTYLVVRRLKRHECSIV